MRIGTAGWSIPLASADAFPGDGQHLQRYARVFGCAEIDTSFHRGHRVETYARWAAMTPPGFRFAVKLPRSITHDARLRDARAPLESFLAEVAGLGERLGVLLVQLPPSLRYEAEPVREFLALLRGLHDGAVACEPRHASWFSPEAERALAEARVSRVAADPARTPSASQPGGWRGPGGDGRGAVLYFRWHGSPRMYSSRYGRDWLAARARELARWPEEAAIWCVFDNTAAGQAIIDAQELQSMLAAPAGVDGLRAP